MKKTLLAEFTAREGTQDEVARLISDYARTVREEEGNLTFDVYTKAANPRAYWIFEVYRDEDAFQAHLKAPTAPRSTPHSPRSSRRTPPS